MRVVTTKHSPFFDGVITNKFLFSDPLAVFIDNPNPLNYVLNNVTMKTHKL